MDKTETLVQMDYEKEPSGKKFNFYLHPVKGVHKAKDIQVAKYWLGRKYGHEYGLVQIRWKMMNDDSEPLSRIPDVAIISNMRVELGKKEAYIDELEEALGVKENTKLTPDQIKEVKSTALYLQQKKQLEKANKTINGLRKNLRQAVSTILELKGEVPKSIKQDDIDDPQSPED